MAPDWSDAVATLAGFLQRYPKVLVLTGAGISTASGIPDYRDRDGVRRGKAPVQGPDFRRHESVRQRYWARSMAGWPVMREAQPNPAHRALAVLEARGQIAGIITQNVDGLHQRAGSRKVVELHGSIHGVVCLDCGAHFERSVIQAMLEHANPLWTTPAGAAPAPDGDAHLEGADWAGFRTPVCDHCAGLLKPNVVFYGDGVPHACSLDAQQQLERADALLVVGSSVMVLSSFRLCKMAAAAGQPIVAINLGQTRAEHLLAFKTEAPAEHILPLLVNWLQIDL